MAVRNSKSPSAAALRCRALIATAVAAAVSPLAARATDVLWNNTSGGFYTTTTNWTGNVVPGPNDIADFNLFSTYTVIVGSSPTNAELNIRAGNVTMAIGTNTYNQTSPNISLAVAGGASVAENASLTLSGGTFNSGVSSAGDVYVGGIGAQASGVNSIGVVNFGGTTAWTLGGNLFLGNYGQGTLNQSGGTLNLGTFFSMGGGSSATGRYNLSAGISNAYIEDLGAYGTGIVVQSGGTNNVGYLEIAAAAPFAPTAPAAGLYNLSAGLLTVGIIDSVGEYGRGNFNQIGGTHVANTVLLVGNQIGSSGTYTLSGGSLQANAGATIGNNGAGVFNQTGGIHTVVGKLGLAAGTNSIGTYSLGGSGTLTVINGATIIGDQGSGIFNQSGGSANLNGGSVHVGNATGSSGVVNMTGGTFSTSYSIIVGDYGAGAFSQSNGAVIANSVLVAYNANSIGNYVMTGGTLVANNMTIADDQNTFGYFQQSGGTTTVGTTLVIAAFSSGSVGTYQLTGGVLNAGQIFVGRTGNGTFYETAGTANIGDLNLGIYASATSTANFTGGTLNVTGTMTLGQVPGGAGSFAQNSGVASVASLVIGQVGASSGTYTLYGGVLNGNVETVGAAGGGTFSQVGGTNTVSGLLTVGAAGATGGVYNLSAGTLNAAGLTVGAPGTLNQSGGVLNATSPLVNQGTFTYSGGTFVGRVNNQGLLALGGAANFAPSNGIQNDGTFTLAAGQTFTALGSGLANNGLVQLQGGTLTGPTTLVNSGQINGYGTLGGSAGFTNYNLITEAGGNLALTNSGLNQNLGSIYLAAGHQLQLGGSGLTNGGSIALTGALINGAQPLVNAAGGIVAGPGLISAPFFNSGGTLLVPAGTLNVATPFNNAGFIQFNGGTLIGAAIANTGSIEGAGFVGSPLNNSGTIEPIGGTLAASGPLANLAPGLIRAAAGNKFLAVSGLANNLGTINLTGGTFDNNNKPLSNTGIVTGFGTLSTGGLTNAAGGLVVFSNGQATINGTVNNALGGTVRVTYSPALFTAPVTNNGTFKITGTTATFAAPFTNNGLYSSDPATTHFSTLTVTPAGALVGGVGDKFYVSGNFDSASTQATAWDTADGAELHFESGGGGSHIVTLTGDDRGATPGGYVDNFAWGIVALDAGQTLDLTDGNATPGGALYTKALVLNGALDSTNLAAFVAAHVVNADPADPLNIYYDPNSTADAYLAGGTYALGNGGVAAPAPAPEPAALALFAVTGAGLLARQRRARRNCVLPQPSM